MPPFYESGNQFSRYIWYCCLGYTFANERIESERQRIVGELTNRANNEHSHSLTACGSA